MGTDSTPSAGVARGPSGRNGDGDRLVTSIGAQALAPGEGERLETSMGALGGSPGDHRYMLRPRMGPAYSMTREGSLGGTMSGDGDPASGDPGMIRGKWAVASATSCLMASL